MKLVSIRVPKGDAVQVVGDVLYVARTPLMDHDIVCAAFVGDNENWGLYPVLKTLFKKEKEDGKEAVQTKPRKRSR